MVKKVFIDNSYVGLGNVLYFLGNYINEETFSDIVLYHKNDIMDNCSDMFKFDVISGDTDEYDISFSEKDWGDFLNPEVCNFERLKGFVDWNRLDKIEYPFPIDDICVINMRFGDYTTGKNRRTYKTIRRDWLDYVINKYNVLGRFKTIIVVTDNIKMARYVSGKYADAFLFYHSDPLKDFNLLLRAKLIIGSCSTFSFAGCMLNRNDANMVVEYPYYQYPNPFNFDADREESLYNDKRIIKETYEKPSQTAAICAMMKDEHDYLDEWIRWHIKLGFNKFFLFEDINSSPHDEICRKYKEVSLIKVKDLDLDGYYTVDYGSFRQLAVYNMFLDKYRNETDWVLFIDLDEYVQFDNGYNLQKFMSDFRRYPGVFVYWKLIGWGGNIKKTSNDVVNRFHGEGKLLKGDDAWDYKSFVNFNYGDSTLETIHRVTNGVNTAGLCTIKIQCFQKCWINHYFTKSWEEWLTQLFKRGDTFSAHRCVVDFFETNIIEKETQNELMGDLLSLDGENGNTINYYVPNRELTEVEKRNIASWKKHMPGYGFVEWNSKIFKRLPKKILEYFNNDEENEVFIDYIKSYVLYNNGGLFFDLDFELKEPLDQLKSGLVWFMLDNDGKKTYACRAPKGNLINERNMHYIEKTIMNRNDEATSQMSYVLKLLFGYINFWYPNNFFGVTLMPFLEDDKDKKERED